MINARNEAQQLLLDQVATGRLDRRKFLSMIRGLVGTTLLASSAVEQAFAFRTKTSATTRLRSKRATTIL